MIAKAKAVAHGIAALRYITGESANKKHPEKISHVCSHLLSPGQDAMGMWTSIGITMGNFPKVRNTVLRIEVSPAKEHTAGFTKDDWQQLWREFAAEFDRQTITNGKGETISPRTNISGSKHTVWLHEESESGTPHLHAIVCRADEDGHINNDHAIHLRAQRAAERIAKRRGWTTAAEIRGGNLAQVNADCLDALKTMSAWSWQDYLQRLSSKGYDVRLRRDSKDKVVGYVIAKGNARYKASELGTARNLMASKIESTWRRLHPAPAEIAAIPTRHHPKDNTQPLVTSPQDKPQDYTRRLPDTQRAEIEWGGKTYIRYIPDTAMDVFDTGFDYRETLNWQPLTNLAMAFFTMLATPETGIVSGGGGGTTSDMKWGRDPKEDDRDWALRCSRAAKAKLGITPRTGRKR